MSYVLGRKQARSGAAFRSLLLVVAVLAAALLAAWQFIGSRIDNEIRLEVQRKFAEQYSDFHVTLRSARLIEGRGVELQGLWVMDRETRIPIVYVDEIFASCSLDKKQLLAGEHPSATHVLVRGLKVWMERKSDASWVARKLWPPPKFGDRPPPVTIENGELTVVDQLGGGKRMLGVRNIDLEVVPEVRSALSDRTVRNSFELEYHVNGTMEADHVNSLRVEGVYRPGEGQWWADGSIGGVRLSPDLLRSLPLECDRQSSKLTSIRGRIDAGFHLVGRVGGPSLIEDYRLTGKWTAGEILDRRLPDRLYDVSAEWFCDTQRMTIQNLEARNGASQVRLSFTRYGWTDDSPMSLHVLANDLALDQRYARVLPESALKVWRSYYPEGLVNVDARLEFDGHRWTPEFAAECKDISFAYEKFPYRLERTRGTVTLKDDLLTARLKASASGHTVHLLADIRDPDGEATGQIRVKTEGPIPLNDKLLAAIPDPKAQEVIHNLNPGGWITVDGTFSRNGPKAEDASKSVRFDLHDCSMRYEKFPYPFGMIRGTIVWNDSGWSFIDLSGRNDTGYVECNGSWKPTTAGDSLLALDFVGADIPLEDELKRALQPNAQRQWDQIQPRGTVDHLEVNLRYQTMSKDLSVVVHGKKWQENGSSEGRSITVRPSWFPYRLYDLTGEVQYEDGQVQLKNVAAVHDNTRVRISGTCNFAPHGDWNVYLAEVTADGLKFDSELLAALPKGLGGAVGKLNLQGDISMYGAMSFAGHAAAAIEPTTRWDVTCDIENGHMQCGPVLEHIHGNVRLFGGSDAQSFQSRGELDVDSLICRDVQLVGVRGPLLVDASQAIFGTEAERDRRDAPPRSVTAQVFGGVASADAVVRFEDEVPFFVHARLDRADLTTLGQELDLKTREIHGRANAAINLSGNRYGYHTWQGKGFVRLYEADIYQVPVMLSLLKVLKIRQPDTTAFTSSDIDFRMEGEHVYLDRINFNGDLISLKGHGELGLDRHIALKFYTLVGRQEFSLPAVRAMLQQASQQILLIHVNGTLDDPRMTREALPALKETLDQLFPELNRSDRLDRLPPPPEDYEHERRVGLLRQRWANRQGASLQ